MNRASAGGVERIGGGFASGAGVFARGPAEWEPLASAADARGRVFEQGTRGFLELELAVLAEGDPGLAEEVSAALAAGAVEYWDVVAEFDEEGRYDGPSGRQFLLDE